MQQQPQECTWRKWLWQNKYGNQIRKYQKIENNFLNKLAYGKQMADIKIIIYIY